MTRDGSGNAPDLSAALRSSDERLRLALDAGQIGTWDWDIVNDHVIWSERVYEMHGLEPGEFGGTVGDFARFVHPDDASAVSQRIDEALRSGATYEIEFRIVRPDGRIRWLTTRAYVVRNAEGGAIRLIGATSDVTERVELLQAEREARAAAEAARRRLELLATAGTVMARSLEPNETLQAIASVIVPGIADWCRIDLLDADGVLQRALTHHSDPERSRVGAELASRLKAAPGAAGSMAWAIATGESRIVHFDPPSEFDAVRDSDVLTFATAIGMRSYYVVPLTARGRTLGALAAVQAESGRAFSESDCALISLLAQRAALAIDNARLFAETEAARRQAEAANRSKDEFLAMLGHELRNPLAPIVTALSLMELRDPTTVGERRIIERQVAHLSRLVDDLLDVARITQGKIPLQRERSDLKAIVARALELAQPVLLQRSRPIEIDIATDEAFVHGDPVRLAQVFTNLLTNAGKFTAPDGPIALRLRVAEDRIVVDVEDAGAGIDAELLPRIFDVFVQGRQPIDRQAGGLGLGLAIVKTLVAMHGGAIDAFSDGPGRGSRFSVSLPRLVAHEIDAVQPMSTIGSHRGSGRVLVVDDNADAALTLSELMRGVGYEVRTAGNADEALRTLDGFAPDVAVLDIGLPGVDGYTLAQRLRSDVRAPHVRLVALTGYGRDPDRVRAIESSFDEHLVKPVAADRLLDVVQRLTS